MVFAMTLDEFQVWFQAYVTGIQSRSLNPTSTVANDIDKVISEADLIANHALDLYKKVDKPKMPDISKLDLNNVVQKAINAATKK
jgi:hypothetical protein